MAGLSVLPAGEQVELRLAPARLWAVGGLTMLAGLGLVERAARRWWEEART